MERTENFDRSVCKLWSSLPRAPKFVGPPLHQSCQAPNVIVMSYRNAEDHTHTLLSFYSIEVSETGNVARLIFTVRLEVDFYSMEPSVDGLVCFSAQVSRKIYICNPSTHELLQLPIVASSDAPTSELAGFGFDCSTGTYKVLCAFVSGQRVKWFIYTLGSWDGRWRKLDQISTPDHQIQPGQHAYIGGVVHWIFRGKEDSVPCGILTFNLRDETFGLLALPNPPSWTPDLRCHEFHLRLKEIGGYLRLIAILRSGSRIWALCMWTLRDYKTHEWTPDLAFHINILESCQMRLYIPIPVDIRNGKVFISFGSKLYYTDDLRRGAVTEINDGMPEEQGKETIKQYQANFVASFIPIGYNIWH